MTPENALEKKIIDELQKRGWFAHHFDAVGCDGWPDILAIQGNRFVLIEVKAGTKLRKEQIAFHSFLQQMHGVDTFVIELKKGDYVVDGMYSFSTLPEAIDRVLL